MAYHTWHDYGYGVNLHGLEFNSPERVVALLSRVPSILEHIKREFEVNEITEPTVEDYIEYGDFTCGIAGMLSEVIEQKEKIFFYVCEDFDGCKYIMYTPCYPWEMRWRDRRMTKKKIQKVLSKYLKILTDSHFDIELVESANGG